MKAYVWLEPGKLKFINDNPQVVSLLYDLGLLPEEISARVREYVAEERERIAKLIESKAAPKELDGLAAVRPWNEIVEALANEVRSQPR